jgi:hypothetical protein
MIFKIQSIKDEFLEYIYNESIKDLNDFYEINWTNNLPKIFVVDDRNTIDLLKNKKTERWVRGWAEGNKIYILNKDNTEKESSHKYNPEEYSAFIKHELSHSFYNVLAEKNYRPIWLNDGVAVYISGQNKFNKRKPKEFCKFLEFYDHGDNELYYESGFFIEFLVEKFGKEKLLNLIKESKNAKTETKFSELFVKEYGFELTYKEINKSFYKFIK